MEAIARVDMSELAEHSFAALSGGQKQRILLARALAGSPSLLLLDEPTAGMDMVATSGVLDMLSKLHRESGLTILLVSHQLNEVTSHVARLGLFAERQFQIGDVDELLTDAQLSAMYRAPIHVVEADGRRLVFPVPSQAAGLTSSERDV
jgi:ABC-type Mn2+/Zn2+ transport system ATPase subunit